MDQFFRMKIGVFADSYLNIQSGAKQGAMHAFFRAKNH